MKTGNIDSHKCRYKKLKNPAISKGYLKLQKRLFVVLTILFVGLVVFNIYATGLIQIAPIKYFQALVTQETKIKHSGYLLNTKGCSLPAIDPLDPDIINRFIESDKTLKCDSAFYPRLVESNETAIFINPDSKLYYYEYRERIECCWRSFWRTENEDDHVTFNQSCNTFQESALITDEFIKVTCWKRKDGKTLPKSEQNETVFRDYFAFVPRKQPVEERCQKLRAPKSEKPLSVLIVGIDSVSRLNLHRQMPRTVEALKTLDALEMLGYTKVGDNTYPNLVPVLSGMSEKEFNDACWQSYFKPFDSCPFLWKNFSAAGYRTIFAEDAYSLNTFNYFKPGFREAPTDYYLRPFFQASEKDIGNTHRYNTNICVGSTMNFANLLHHTKKVVSQFAKDPYFAFVWGVSLTHDYFDYPRFGDEEYAEFLRYLGSKDLLESTALVFMSDHGIRFGVYRLTQTGQMEESLPFMFLALPNWWKTQYPTAFSSLKKNTHALTTPFDLHETLVDLLNMDVLQEESLKKRAEKLAKETIPRGISWFLPIPNHRDCDMASIPDHFCQCHKTSNVSLEDPLVIKNADFLVGEINEMLQKYPQCATLKVEKVIDARVWNDGENVEIKDDVSWTDFTIMLQTVPGAAIFEGISRYRDKGNTTLLGTISRLNSYGNQSACVDDSHLHLYCFCNVNVFTAF